MACTALSSVAVPLTVKPGHGAVTVLAFGALMPSKGNTLSTVLQGAPLEWLATKLLKSAWVGTSR